MKFRILVALLAAMTAVQASFAAETKKVVFIAGKPSHAPGDHEHRAGCLLLQQCLSGVSGLETTVVTNGWPEDESVFNGVDAVVIYSDGGAGHPAVQGDNMKTLGRLLDQGVGLACIHYAVEVPKERGGDEFTRWLGGYFETHWSVNPHWVADFEQLPVHEITRGVDPFAIRDEWYFHMRFREGMMQVRPLLSAVPPASTMERPDGAHSGNPFVREAVANEEPQHVAWASIRENGGRGFGFTGGHYHRNWGNDHFRKLVLNAVLWVARIEVPEDGVDSTVTSEDLSRNLDPKPGPKPEF